MHQPRTNQRCDCRPGRERDNCSSCEGTGWRIDFAAIRARRNPERHTPCDINHPRYDYDDHIVCADLCEWRCPRCRWICRRESIAPESDVDVILAESNPGLCEGHLSPNCTRDIVGEYDMPINVYSGPRQMTEPHKVCRYHAEKAARLGYNVVYYNYESNPPAAQTRLIEAFARGATRGKAGAMRIEGNLLYSYAEPIARNDEDCFVVKEGMMRGSATSSHHLNGARRILSEFGPIKSVPREFDLRSEENPEGIPQSGWVPYEQQREPTGGISTYWRFQGLPPPTYRQSPAPQSNPTWLGRRRQVTTPNNACRDGCGCICSLGCDGSCCRDCTRFSPTYRQSPAPQSNPRRQRRDTGGPHLTGCRIEGDGFWCPACGRWRCICHPLSHR